MANELKKFRLKEIILNKEESAQVLNFFWANTVSNPNTLNNVHCAFAQALLLEAIDASGKIGFLESLYSATIRPRSSLKRIIEKFVRYAALRWFQNITGRDNLKNARIYKKVKNTLALSFLETSREIKNMLPITAYRLM